MTQEAFLKVYVGKGETIAYDSTTDYKKTEKMIKDIVFVCDRWGDRYPNRNIRSADLMKFIPGIRNDISSGCVYCFSSDLEKAKLILVESINMRLVRAVDSFMKQMAWHAESVKNVSGVKTVKIIPEYETKS
ncbi:hypothetical protein HOS54_gp049 [Klebsiella phage Menlow]|uniref:Uncharacterized protein n=1 Tax=Klebsiella phage Menlow TaxID=2054273 RepID=A0A2H5BNI2_9CAUD|nr:hypothetical protein HOS54_gp049 [Klebsiella phage Menlow]AUG87900.1 hypothetical protein CPT_Menlow_198 [Klebsiella phage Menlow]